MKVHHLNCGTMAFGVVDHCLLVELPAGDLMLVDTGFGLDCVQNPALLGWTRHLIQPALLEAETAIRQIQELGYEPKDVRNIVVTHLDYDHTGGLADFPGATVHVYGPEHRAGMKPTALERIRYRPDELWAHGVRWAVNENTDEGDRWYGFNAVRQLAGLPPEILVIPLVGHSRGHAGVAIDTGDRWLLHAGDAYALPGVVTPGLTGIAHRALNLVTANPTMPLVQLQNMNRLADLVAQHGDEVTVSVATTRRPSTSLRTLPRIASNSTAGQCSPPSIVSMWTCTSPTRKPNPPPSQTTSHSSSLNTGRIIASKSSSSSRPNASTTVLSMSSAVVT